MRKILILLFSLILMNGCEQRTAKMQQDTDDMQSGVSQSQAVSSLPALPEESKPSSSEPQVSSEQVLETFKSSSSSSLAVQQEEALLASSSTPEAPPQTTDDWRLILVNYENPIPEGFYPELEEVQNGFVADARIVQAAKDMIAAAREQGIELLVCSAYRPYASQKRNYDNSVQAYISKGYSEANAKIETEKLIAVPGYSEHHTGLALDIVTPSYQMLNDGFAKTDAGKWLAKNAPEYGFILRYPKDKTEITKISYEPWHFRYVGTQAAQEITAQGLCLEEYLQQKP